jgi:hypothetical protein
MEDCGLRDGDWEDRLCWDWVSKDVIIRHRTTAYILTYIHAYIHTYTHTYIHTYTHTHMHTYIHTCIHLHI